MKREAPVAVLFADVEGCTRLCELLPPAEMNAIIEAYFSAFFEAVEDARGTVNEIMGDGFMAIFSRPRLGDSVRGAAQAAAAIRARARALHGRNPQPPAPILVNMGIHAGSAFVGFTRFRTSRREYRTYTASGPVANVAARLCALATGGAVLVSAEAARHLEGGEHALAPLGRQTLKNVIRPIVAYRLGEKDGGRSPSPRPAGASHPAQQESCFTS